MKTTWLTCLALLTVLQNAAMASEAWIEKLRNDLPLLGQPPLTRLERPLRP